ncbi:MAG TPA: cupin domain-containing protein [Candidatus Acidoferrum sp.]|nr:cupin domain-containing protein [Candidatus Acidoferrum sp.]
MNPPAILFTLAAAKRDPALQTRGQRKILVTELYDTKEEVASATYWSPQASSGKCPVLLMQDTESAVFSQVAKQTRHCHKIGTEIYVLLEGRMTIEVEGTDYPLSPGDTLVVLPGAYHQVRRDGEFLCRVFTVSCSGTKDRYEQ